VHPYVYSALAPFLMSALGISTCGLIAAVGSAILFARLMRHSDRPMLASLTGAFFWAANIASGRVTFALGALAALGALVALPRLRLAAVLALLTGLLSPVAAAFLGFIAALLVVHRRTGGWTIGAAASVPVVVLAGLFHGGGIQPMSPGSAVPGVLVGLALAYFTSHPLVRTGSLLYALAVLGFALHDDPFGSNVLRLGLLVSVPLLLATTARRTPVVLAVVSCGFLAWQLDPLVGDLLSPPSAPFTALNQHLREVGSHRVEVLAGRDHREASDVAEVMPIARGWARQIDVRDNPLFYRPEPLTQPEYLTWLRERAIDRVAVPKRGKLDFGSVLAAALLQRPVKGLSLEWQNADWVVYRVDRPRTIVALPGVLEHYDRTTLALRSSQAGPVAVAVRPSRWLSLSGPACLDVKGNQVLVRFLAPGRVELTSSLRPAGRC